MSRTPTDEEISIKAIAFDRKHFADGIDPAPERIVENHKRLKDDPKLLTRLVPRFISTLAFFEGYKQACDEQASASGYAARTAEWMAAQTALDNEKEAHRRTQSELGVMKDRLAVLTKDPKNIGIVIKPPPPPPPAAAPPPIVDPWIWEGEYNGLACRVGRTGSVDLYVEGKWANTGDAGTSICRRHAIVALVARLDAYEEAIASIREAWKQSEAERLAMKEERDRVRAWEARTGETQPRIVQAKLENDKPIASDELRTGVDDELAQAAADYANADYGREPIENDVVRVRRACAIDRTVMTQSGFADLSRGFVNGARWQLNRIENAAGEDPPNVHELREENERLKQRLVFFEVSEDERTKSKLAWLKSLDGEPTLTSTLYVEDGKVMFRGASGQTTVVASSEPNGDVSLAPTPIVFRDDNERDYWDSVSLTLAKKQETTAQSVASGADEMIEERRLRNPLAKQVRDELHDAENDGHRYNAFLLDGKLRVTHYGQTTEYDVENDERFKGKLAKKIAWIIRHELRDREDTPQSMELTNGILLRAIEYACEMVGQPSWSADDNFYNASNALKTPKSPTGPWTRTICSYVAGALAK